MTDIARVVASLACCGGLFVVCAVAWAMCAVARLDDRGLEEPDLIEYEENRR